MVARVAVDQGVFTEPVFKQLRASTHKWDTLSDVPTSVSGHVLCISKETTLESMRSGKPKSQI